MSLRRLEAEVAAEDAAVALKNQIRPDELFPHEPQYQAHYLVWGKQNQTGKDTPPG